VSQPSTEGKKEGIMDQITYHQKQFTLLKLPCHVEHMTALVAALEGDVYEQARNYLQRMNGHMCCLGVGADISDLGEWQPREEFSYEYCIPGYNPEVLSWNRPLAEYYGVGYQLENIDDSSATSLLVAVRSDIPFPSTEDVLKLCRIQSINGANYLHAATLNDANGRERFSFRDIATVLRKVYLPQ
jgi:hypothetical protein